MPVPRPPYFNYPYPVLCYSIPPYLNRTPSHASSASLSMNTMACLVITSTSNHPLSPYTHSLTPSTHRSLPPLTYTPPLPPLTRSHTIFPHSLIPLLTHSFTHSSFPITHSLIHSLTHSLTHSTPGILRQEPGFPIMECNDLCSCPPTCSNRVVQRGRKIKVIL